MDGDRMPLFAGKLPSPPQHEWLELVKYWNAGGRTPVWFVADPLRTDIDMVDHPDPDRIPVAVAVPGARLSGVRPNEMDWYVIERPGWYLGEGWSLTPETAGVAAREPRPPGADGRLDRREVFGGHADDRRTEYRRAFRHGHAHDERIGRADRRLRTARARSCPSSTP